MKLAHLLTEQRVVLELKARTCDEVMVEMVEELGKQGVLLNGMKDEALSALREREDQISTGVGCGVGLPHAYLGGLSEAVAMFGKSEDGIEFDSCDHAPVHFVVMLLIPEENKGQHLLTLADVGKRFLSCEVRKDLSKAEDAATVLGILSR
ncbi:MAG: PTS sugar transporter subunit IIA [Verrucomicrobiota bacterium]